MALKISKTEFVHTYSVPLATMEDKFTRLEIRGVSTGRYGTRANDRRRRSAHKVEELVVRRRRRLMMNANR